MPSENILQSLQRLITIAQRLDALAERVDRLQSLVFARLDRLEDQVTDLRERLARLEASRDADHSRMQADLARFKLEVERAEFRLSRRAPQSEPPLLPEGRDDEDSDQP